MDNWGPNSNKSSFFITLGDADFMNELHVVFGKILNGMNVLREIEQEKTSPKGIKNRNSPSNIFPHLENDDDQFAEPILPINEIIISKCGTKVPLENHFEVFEEVLDDSDDEINVDYHDEL